MSQLTNIWYSALGVVIIVSCVFNIALLKYTFRRPVLKFKDKATMSLSVSDLLRAVIGYTTEIVMSSFNLQTRQTMCKPLGFTISFFSYIAIYQLTQLTLDRWVKITRASHVEEFYSSNTATTLAVASCWLLALAFSVMPIFGLGAYGLEGDSMRCSVLWSSKATLHIIYVVLLFIFGFILPLLIMLCSYICVRRVIRRSRVSVLGRFEATTSSVVIRLKFKAEKRNALIFFTMALVFLLAWTPYAVISFLAAFASTSVTVPNLVQLIAVLPAKASTLYNPLIMAWCDKQFRAYVKSLFGFTNCRPGAVAPGPATECVTTNVTK